MGDVRCQLLVKNLPGLISLLICSALFNSAGNNLSDLAVRSVCQLRQLTGLIIGTHALIEV